MNPRLQLEVDKLILWCEQNAADDRDLREALTQVGMAMGVRGAAAYEAELAAVRAFRNGELNKTGKVPIVAADAAASVAVAEIDAVAIKV